jgi:hypothetical protein
MALRDVFSTHALPIGLGLGLLLAWSRQRGRSKTGRPVDVLPLTPRSSGRVRDKVPSSYTGVRAAQLNR